MKLHDISIVTLCLVVFSLNTHAQRDVVRVGAEVSRVTEGATMAAQQAATSAIEASVRSSVQAAEAARAATVPTGFAEIKEAGLNRHLPSSTAMFQPSTMALTKAEEIALEDFWKRVKLANASEYITPAQRTQYRLDFEKLRTKYAEVLAHRPSNLDNLTSINRYLRHSVPAETMKFLTDSYREVVVTTDELHKEISAWLAYASLPGEGKRLSPQKTRRFNDAIYKVRSQVKKLSDHIQEDPYLEAVEDYWLYMFGTLNPLLRGVLSLSSGFKLDRTDRVLIAREFFLYDVHGVDYIFPKQEFTFAGQTFEYPGSSTLIIDPEDMEEESPLYVRGEQDFLIKWAEAMAPERDMLLQKIPENLRIAFINDDTLPRINFQGWQKKGYLGKGATLDTYKTGTEFMDAVRKGAKYDLVLTDLLVENGGAYMMEEFRHYDPMATVIAVSKYDREEEIDPKKYYDMGMDGYLWYTYNLNQGMVGYMEYLRAMANYYSLRSYYHWLR